MLHDEHVSQLTSLFDEPDDRCCWSREFNYSIVVTLNVRISMRNPINVAGMASDFVLASGVVHSDDSVSFNGKL
jgi:hypothetical protein